MRKKLFLVAVLGYSAPFWGANLCQERVQEIFQGETFPSGTMDGTLPKRVLERMFLLRDSGLYRGKVITSASYESFSRIGTNTASTDLHMASAVGLLRRVGPGQYMESPNMEVLLGKVREKSVTRTRNPYHVFYSFFKINASGKEFRKSDIIKWATIGGTTLDNYMSTMIRDNIIERMGQGRSIRYRFLKNAEEILQKMTEKTSFSSGTMDGTLPKRVLERMFLLRDSGVYRGKIITFSSYERFSGINKNSAFTDLHMASAVGLLRRVGPGQYMESPNMEVLLEKVREKSVTRTRNPYHVFYSFFKINASGKEFRRSDVIKWATIDGVAFDNYMSTMIKDNIIERMGQRGSIRYRFLKNAEEILQKMTEKTSFSSGTMDGTLPKGVLERMFLLRNSGVYRGRVITFTSYKRFRGINAGTSLTDLHMASAVGLLRRVGPGQYMESPNMEVLLEKVRERSVARAPRKRHYVFYSFLKTNASRKEFTRSDIVGWAAIDGLTASHYLSAMIRDNIIERMGQGRSIRYRFLKNAEEILQKMTEEIEPVRVTMDKTLERNPFNVLYVAFNSGAFAKGATVADLAFFAGVSESQARRYITFGESIGAVVMRRKRERRQVVFRFSDRAENIFRERIRKINTNITMDGTLPEEVLRRLFSFWESRKSKGTGKVTISEYKNFAGVSKMTATGDLHMAANLGLLKGERMGVFKVVPDMGILLEEVRDQSVNRIPRNAHTVLLNALESGDFSGEFTSIELAAYGSIAWARACYYLSLAIDTGNIIEKMGRGKGIRYKFLKGAKEAIEEKIRSR